MSYNVSGSGHGADIEKVKQAFADFVEALDEATAPDGTQFSGTISGGETAAGGSWTNFTVSAHELREAQPVDPDAAEAEPAPEDES